MSFKRSRIVILGDVVRGGYIGEVVAHVLRQPRWQILRHVTTVVGIGTGLAAFEPTRAGEHQRRAYRKEYPNTGA